MTPFEQHLQALADLWNQGGKAYLTAQQSMLTGMADTMAKASSVGDKATFQAFAPDTKAFEAAQQDFSKLWSSASELSAALTKNLQGADREAPHVADVRGILVNIFGGIMKCDIIAEGVVAAVKEVGLKVPLVVRLEGTNVDLGKKIIAESKLNVTSADDLDDAAQKIVAAVKKAA